jgi:hypothetical protein
MLSGAKGQLYGNAFNWMFMPDWQNYLDSEGATQFMIWRSFFQSLPRWELVPDQAHTEVRADLAPLEARKLELP